MAITISNLPDQLRLSSFTHIVVISSTSTDGYYDWLKDYIERNNG
jgi:hypothetical protein